MIFLVFQHIRRLLVYKVMIRFYSCENGFVEKDERGSHFWINVENPSLSDREFLLGELGVPVSFLDNIADEDERPRFERECGWLLTIIRIPIKSGKDFYSYTTIPMGVITKGEIVVSVCHADTEMIPDFIDHTRRRHIKIETHPDFILRLIYSSTYWYLRYLKMIDNTVTDSMGDLEKAVTNKDLLNLMKLQNALVFFNTSLKGNSMLIERLDKEFEDTPDADLMEDVDIELQQADNTVNVYMEILDSATDTFASIVSNNVNQIMKKMTSVSIILMIPTLIASFYGMNVAVAFADRPHAFWLIALVSFALAVLIYFVLRRTKWF